MPQDDAIAAARAIEAKGQNAQRTLVQAYIPNQLLVNRQPFYMRSACNSPLHACLGLQWHMHLLPSSTAAAIYPKQALHDLLSLVRYISLQEPSACIHSILFALSGMICISRATAALLLLDVPVHPTLADWLSRLRHALPAWKTVGVHGCPIPAMS